VGGERNSKSIHKGALRSYKTRMQYASVVFVRGCDIFHTRKHNGHRPTLKGKSFIFMRPVF